MDKKSDFYIGYWGNKRTEIKYIEHLLNDIKYNKIIEPFGGTCSISRYIYNNIDINKEKEYYISDVNKDLTFFCNNFYKYDDIIINKCIENINLFDTKTKYNEYVNNKVFNDDIDRLVYYLFINKHKYIRPGLYPSTRKITLKNYKTDMINTNNFFKNIYYHNQSYKIFFDNFKDDENALIFLDPPYIQTSNAFYDYYDNHNDSYDIYKNIINLFKNCKCKIIYIVPYDPLLHLLFDEYTYMIYDKKYCSNPLYKKKLQHVVYTKNI